MPTFSVSLIQTSLFDVINYVFLSSVSDNSLFTKKTKKKLNFNLKTVSFELITSIIPVRFLKNKSNRWPICLFFFYNILCCRPLFNYFGTGGRGRERVSGGRNVIKSRCAIYSFVLIAHLEHLAHLLYLMLIKSFIENSRSRYLRSFHSSLPLLHIHCKKFDCIFNLWREIRTPDFR